MAASPSSHPLAQHMQALYPLAHVLVGTKDARSLTRRVYEHAASVPPADRPSDERAWLFQLMIDAQNDALDVAGSEATLTTDTSFTNDPLRREVATQMAKRKLPVAFAACSLRERFLLAIDALADPSDEVLAVVFDTSSTDAGTARDQAHSALRASLRDVLTGPERMLVDVALPDDALRSHLRTFLTDRFQPVPASLRSDVSDILAEAQADRAGPASSTQRDREWLSSLGNALLSRRGLLALLLGLGIVAIGVGSLSYWSASPSSPPSTNVVDLSVQRAPALQTTHPTRTPAEAASYIQQTWNRRLSVPQITGATLKGVGQAMVGNQAIPVLLYTEDDDARRIAAYAFNYALLDRLADRVVLAESLRTRLAAPNPLLVRQRSDETVALWRRQDEIFVLVAPRTNAGALRNRITR